MLGALTFSAIMIPWIGTRRSEGLLILIPLAAALTVLAPLVRRSRSQIGAALLTASAVAAVFLAFNVSDVPGELIAYGRRMMITRNSSEILFTAEGINSSIAISRWSDGAAQFHVSGKVEASTEPYDMRLQRMLGHLPAADPPRPAFGAGCRLRRRRHRRHVRAPPQHRSHRHLRDGAAHPANGQDLLSRTALRRPGRPTHPHGLTTTPATMS